MCHCFPSLYPVLQPDYVAKEVVAATLRDEEILLIARALAVNFFLTGILQFTALLVLSDFLQVGVSEHTPRDEKKSD
ncbi:unnamed protein product [Pocillopora meandrina]|uniref:Uncharacterized protein n=1 Tax=Pocillopora meandrina TaxID=46732 RepID=A0AAU9XCG3_9CNID|nr:unnamed protein product [Pocillopora meandrina]